MFRGLLILCLMSGSVFAQTVTQAEFFTGPDPGPGSGTPITVASPDDSVALSASVPTTGLIPGLQRVFLRVRDSGNRWSQAVPQYLIILPPAAQTRLIQTLDYQVDNGSLVHLDPPDASAVSLNEIVATAGLTDGLHRFKVRCTDDLGRTAVLTDAWLLVSANGTQVRRITQMEYRVDDGTPTVVDVADAPSVDLNAVLDSGSLSVGLHRLRVTGTDDLGRTSQLTDGFLMVTSPGGVPQIRRITQMEYWLDSNTPTVLDVEDNPEVLFNQMLATGDIPVGMHLLYLRATDDLGRTSMAHCWPLIVTSPFGPATPRTITAAEYYVNVDPGPGNGLPIPLPLDGTWDSGEEAVQAVLTGLPLGLHLVGIRVQDNAGRWSTPITDSLIVGPILVIRSVGNDIVLNWQAGSGADHFTIFRSTTASGPFARLDSTAAYTYTDVGAANLQSRQFYRVTFTTTTLSTFRLPGPTIPPPRD